MGDATVFREELGLTVREYQVLDYVRGHRPRVVPFDELRDAVFGEFAGESRARDTVWRIRRKLGAGVLVTVHGFGVRFGMGKVVEAAARCPACGRPVANYREEWTCFACGANGGRKQLEAAELEVGRAGYQPGTRQGTAWTDEERAFVLANMDAMTHAEMGAALQRTASAVRGFMGTEGLKKRYVRTDASRPRDSQREKGA